VVVVDPDLGPPATPHALRSALRELDPGALDALGAQLGEPQPLAVLELAPTPEAGRRLTRAAVRRGLVGPGGAATCRPGWWPSMLGW
jgi:hypothetical protein